MCARWCSTTTFTILFTWRARSRRSIISAVAASSCPVEQPATPSPSTRPSAGRRFDEPAVRKARLAEALVILRGLLDGETVTHIGTHYQLDGVRTMPAYQQHLPILVGVNGETRSPTPRSTPTSSVSRCSGERSPTGSGTRCDGSRSVSIRRSPMSAPRRPVRDGSRSATRPVDPGGCGDRRSSAPRPRGSPNGSTGSRRRSRCQRRSSRSGRTTRSPTTSWSVAGASGSPTSASATPAPFAPVIENGSDRPSRQHGD